MEQTAVFPPRYSNLPEALPGTYPVATAHDAPEVYKPETTLQNKSVPWWRRYWILLLVLAVVIAGGAIGGGVGGALATRKNDSQSVATPVRTATGLGVTTTSISSSVSTTVAPGTVSTTSSSTQSIPPQKTITVSASTVSVSSLSTSEPPTTTAVITSAITVQTTIEVASVSTTTSTPAPPTPITTTATAAPTPTPAPGTDVYIGQNTQEQVAFLYHDACQNYVFLEYLGTGVCDMPFTLSDGVTYTVHGCGGTPWMTWGPGTLLGSGTCAFSSSGMPDCPEWNITGAWICG